MEKKLPAGRLGRVARLAALGVRTGAGMVLGRDEGAANQAAEILGTLRGLAAKVGQMASYVDGLVPEERREAFETSLKVLRSQAPRSSPQAIRALVEQELGAPIRELFAEWHDDPIASASIGQVHKARLHDGGLEVAVKVQHPGIRKAVESDLANAGILEGIAGLGGARRFGSTQHLETIRERFREELDYELEAERVVAFAKIHEGDPHIHVPRLVAERSSRSVLTTELVRGAALEDVAKLTEAERRAYAETLWRYVFKGNLVGGMFNADPHPGNYLFQDHGRIAFLDYGCVQVIPEHRRPVARALHRAACRKDEAEFERCVKKILDTKPGELERLSVAYSRYAFEPLFCTPYRITRSYAASLVDKMREMGMRARKLPEREVYPIPSEMLFMNRLQFGFYSVLARLDVEVDFAAVEEGFLGGEDG